MNLDKQEIKDRLTQLALGAITETGIRKKAVRKGKIKVIHKAKNDAQANRMTGQTKQKRKQSARKSKRGKKKKGTLHQKKRTKMLIKKSTRRGAGLRHK